MDVEKASLCNCVVNFLLQENYLLSAFELLHELVEDGRHDLAIRLKEFFSDTSLFPPDQISRLSALRVADPRSLLEEKETLEEKLAISEYELRLAQEDVLKLRADLQKSIEYSTDDLDDSHEASIISEASSCHQRKKILSFSGLGPLKDGERRDLNCAIKEYLLSAGYRLTAMTFYEEVKDQNLDVWQNTAASVPDALRHYYYQYLSSTSEAAEAWSSCYFIFSFMVSEQGLQIFSTYSSSIKEKMSILQEKDALQEANEKLHKERESLLEHKETADSQLAALGKSLECLQKDIKDREILIQDLKQSLELKRKELNDSRAEITSLKMHIEGSQASRRWVGRGDDQLQTSYVDDYKAEIERLQMELDILRGKRSNRQSSLEFPDQLNEDDHLEERVVEILEDKTMMSHSENPISDVVEAEVAECYSSFNNKCDESSAGVDEPPVSSFGHGTVNNNGTIFKDDPGAPSGDCATLVKLGNDNVETASERVGSETIQILADALPKIVPYVLINHREELLPLIMCAIERHPASGTRDSLTHTLFNLIKRPDEQQRKIIMDACVNLAKNIGEMRTESELLPQCWEQINHMYEERRLLVAQSCGELAEFVRPEIRASLILSIVQQLVEDSATVVREAAARNLALLLPLFPNMDKYFKVEELMFQLVCDPSGVVVEASLKYLVPAVISWGKKLDHVLRVLLSHILASAQQCPPLSGVEGSVDSHLRVLGERERWNVDVLLRMLTDLLPFVHDHAIETCPFPSDDTESLSSPETKISFSHSMLEKYTGGHTEWPAFDWLHTECLPTLIQLACLLPSKEDNLRNRIAKFLLAVREHFGDDFLIHIMLPVFLTAVGDSCDLTYFSSSVQSRIKGLKPKTAVAEKLSVMCVLPLLLAGIFGVPSRHEQLAEYLRKLLIQSSLRDNSSELHHTPELIDAVRFLCTFGEHQSIVFNILWEMVVSFNVTMKTSAANLFKVLIPYVDEKAASTHVLPALVTLGSDPNLNVKYSSIYAFGSVAQHFKNDMIVDKIRVQMDAFLEDGSHEATLAVIRALIVAVPNTTNRLRDYILIFQLTAMPTHGNDLMRRREKANAFCESIRALDAADLPATSVKEYLLPAIQNLLKDPDALDPAHKEALENILKERSGGTLDTISKVMGAHLGITSVSSLFGESGLLGRRETTESGLLGKRETGESGLQGQRENGELPDPLASTQSPAEDTRFRRIMRGNFSDMIRGKAKGNEESPRKQ
ncbi:hypothetical protein AMTRI_Chr12g234990 [Amborella trichopoda]